MDILVKAGADVNTINTPGCTALFTLEQKCVKVLLRADILINKVSHHGVNALGYVLIKWGYHSAELLYAAGETLENVSEHTIPDCFKFEDSKFQLKHICREAIRKHLLDLDPHQHLLGRIPKLGLPNVLNRYLLFNETLDDDELDDEQFDETIDGDNGNDEN